MPISPLAGKPASKDILVDLDSLEREYYERHPELADPNQLVAFGTSGHRGRRFVAHSREPTSRLSRGPSVTTVLTRLPAVRSTWGRRPSRLPALPSAPPSRSWLPMAWRVGGARRGAVKQPALGARLFRARGIAVAASSCSRTNAVARLVPGGLPASQAIGSRSTAPSRASCPNDVA